MFEKIGQLRCIKREGEHSSRVVIMLHGFGADASDLAPLADALDPEEQWTFYFPEAPLEVPIGPGWTGRGWFPISLRDLEAGVDFTQIRPPGLDMSRKLVSEVIFNINPEFLVLGGFSQGAMVATDLAMFEPETVNGLVIYSGVLLDQPGWTKKAESLRGKKFVQSHGSSDQVLPFAAGQRLFELLKAHGAEGSMVGFPGGHEIPPQVLKKTQEFLNSFKVGP